MKNVTITLDEDTAKWTRLAAAAREMSVSRYVGEVLRERMDAARDYEAAMGRYLSRQPFRLRGAPERYPRRDELHDRASSKQP